MKRHLVTDAQGTPPGLTLSRASRNDSMRLARTLDAVQGVRAKHHGRPRRGSDKLHADKGYDHRRCRCECHARNSQLGQPRWVVEHTFAWLAGSNA